MFFSCIPRQSLEPSVIFLKACARKARLYYFCINFYDLRLLKEYSGCVMCLQKSRLTDAFIHVFLFFSVTFLSSSCRFLYVIPLHFFILPSSPFIFFFCLCSCRVTYLRAWMRPYWPGLRLWRPWTSPCPRARRTRSSPTPHTTQ